MAHGKGAGKISSSKISSRRMENAQTKSTVSLLWVECGN
ncbi:hypothetical protein ESCOCP328B_20660 [Escherichia coli]